LEVAARVPPEKSRRLLMFDHFDPQSPMLYLLQVLLEALRWARLVITLRRRPGDTPPSNGEGERL
jgi:hypothetical protein